MRKNKEKGFKLKHFRKQTEQPFALLALTFMVLMVVISFFGYRFIKFSPIFLASPTATPVPQMDMVTQEKAGLSRDEYVAKAKEVLAGSLNIPVSEINLSRVEEVRFSDTSLGCPQSGRLYSQVITPGYVIVLVARGNTYTYNAGINKVVSCDSK